MAYGLRTRLSLNVRRGSASAIRRDSPVGQLLGPRRMLIKGMMMITARRMATVVILIISGAGFAASDMELYDDFDGGDRLIDPDKWQGIEVSDGGLIETTRKIDAN